MSVKSLQSKLPRWVRWLLTIIIVIMAALILLILFSIAFFYFGSKPNGKKLFQSVFANPISDIGRLRSGGFSFQGWDVWLTFTSEKDVQLNNVQTFQVLSLAEAQNKLAESTEKHCMNFINDIDAENLEFLYKIDASIDVPNGQFLAHDKINHHYCYQDWYHN